MRMTSKAEQVIDILSERKIKKVVRGKKIQRKLVCKAGYKAVDGKCVRMTPQEVRNRSISQKKAGKKRKAKSQSVANRKRSQSNRLRKAF